MPQITRPQVYRVVYELLPRKRWTPEELVGWLVDTQSRNEAAKRSHARRRAEARQPTFSLAALFT
jgi:hypothetical protein